MNNSSITQNTEEYYFATPVNAIIEVILATPTVITLIITDCLFN